MLILVVMETTLGRVLGRVHLIKVEVTFLCASVSNNDQVWDELKQFSGDQRSEVVAAVGAAVENSNNEVSVGQSCTLIIWKPPPGSSNEAWDGASASAD